MTEISMQLSGADRAVVLDIYMSNNPVHPDELSIWPVGDIADYELQTIYCGRTLPFKADSHEVDKIWSLQIFTFPDQRYRVVLYCNDVKVHSRDLINCDKWTSSSINAIKVSRDDEASEEYRFKKGQCYCVDTLSVSYRPYLSVMFVRTRFPTFRG